MSKTGDILWQPSQSRIDRSELKRFEAFLEARTGQRFERYIDLWNWSITELETFWEILWDFFDIPCSQPFSDVLDARKMPGANWFRGAKLNYVDQIFRHVSSCPNKTALISHSETFGRRELSYQELQGQVASLAARLRAMGVGQGDRVVAILPNCLESMIAFLATASLGAVWSICALDMGHRAVIDRFHQIEPKVLIAQERYILAGKEIDRSEVIDQIAAALPTLTHRIQVPALGSVANATTQSWPDLIADKASLETAQLGYHDPLWVVYSSGTTGSPKPIVHGHIGTLVEMLKHTIHGDLKPTDRFAWFTSSGWIMWNAQLAALLRGATAIQLDLAPNYPDWERLWKIVADEKLTFFGAGAAFYSSCLKAGISPSSFADLSELQGLGSTGSPLPEDAYDWIYSQVKSDIWLAPISGGQK